MSKSKKGSLKEVAGVFFKLGAIGFGGPAAHIAMMQEEVVDKRKWMSQQHFLDLVGATSLIPGPNSTEMTMHCGHERAGVLGLFVAGLCFLFPAIVLTTLLAWVYVEYGELPEVKPFLYGIKPAVLALIVGALWKLGKKAMKNIWLGAIGIAVLAVYIVGVDEVVAILGAGALGLMAGLYQKNKGSVKSMFPFLLPLTGLAAPAVIGNVSIFLYFLKIGSVLFGSGYVLFAYLEGDILAFGLTPEQFNDAIAMGQFTPGPVLSTATFIGYQINGLGGALAATAGIFLPSFLFVWILNPLVPKLRKSKLAAGFLDAVNAGAVGIMAGALLMMGKQSLVDWKTILIAVICTVAYLTWKKVSAVWLVIGGALLGWLIYQI